MCLSHWYFTFMSLSNTWYKGKHIDYIFESACQNKPAILLARLLLCLQHGCTVLIEPNMFYPLLKFVSKIIPLRILPSLQIPPLHISFEEKQRDGSCSSRFKMQNCSFFFWNRGKFFHFSFLLYLITFLFI